MVRALIALIGMLSLNSLASADPPAESGADARKAASSFQVDWMVLSDQGVDASSPSFRMTSTSGQSMVGNRSEGSCYMASVGFWQNFPNYCCRLRRGNVNDDIGDIVDLSDLSLLIYYIVTPRCVTRLYCKDEANVVPGGGGPVDPIDLSDLSLLIAYMTQSGGAIQLPLCP